MATKKAATKATAKGTCQLCGSIQKLPAGLVAKHGYSIRGGAQYGSCEGSGQLPLELSCALIPAAIEEAQAQLAKYENIFAKVGSGKFVADRQLTVYEVQTVDDQLSITDGSGTVVAFGRIENYATIDAVKNYSKEAMWQLRASINHYAINVAQWSDILNDWQPTEVYPIDFKPTTFDCGRNAYMHLRRFQ